MVISVDSCVFFFFFVVVVVVVDDNTNETKKRRESLIRKPLDQAGPGMNDCKGLNEHLQKLCHIVHTSLDDHPG